MGSMQLLTSGVDERTPKRTTSVDDSWPSMRRWLWQVGEMDVLVGHTGPGSADETISAKRSFNREFRLLINSLGRCCGMTLSDQASASYSIKAPESTQSTQSVTQLSCLHAGCGCLAPAPLCSECVAEKSTILPE